MSNVCFAFGQNNSYLLNCPKKWARYNLPAGVERIFTKHPPIKDVYDLVLGPSGSYYFGYRDFDDKPYCTHHGLPFHLTQWLSPRAGHDYIYYDIPTLSITLGPDDSYVVHDKTNLAWCGVPDILAAWLLQHGAQRTKLVALGVESSFVVVNTDGSGLSSIHGGYQGLESVLTSMKNYDEIHYVSLSSYPSISASGGIDQPPFMLVTKDGRGEGYCPQGHEAKFHEAVSNLPNTSPPPAYMSPLASPISSPISRTQPAPTYMRSVSGQATSSNAHQPNNMIPILHGAAHATHALGNAISQTNGNGNGGAVYVDPGTVNYMAPVYIDPGTATYVNPSGVDYVSTTYVDPGVSNNTGIDTSTFATPAVDTSSFATPTFDTSGFASFGGGCGGFGGGGC